MIRDTLDLQWQESTIDVVDILVLHRTTEAGMPTRTDDRVQAQRFDVLPLAKPHRPTRLLERDVEIERLLESIDEDLGRGEGSEIDGRASPVEDDGFEVLLHGFS